MLAPSLQLLLLWLLPKLRCRHTIGSSVLMLLAVLASCTKSQLGTVSSLVVKSTSSFVSRRVAARAFVTNQGRPKVAWSSTTTTTTCFSSTQGIVTDQDLIPNQNHNYHPDTTMTTTTTTDDSTTPTTIAESAVDATTSTTASTETTNINTTATTNATTTHVVPLYRAEGIFAVYKPIDWTSQDVVSYIRGMLEREARERGANPKKVGSRGRGKDQSIKVGHGGTLDPLATGVLVLGVGAGTKQMTSFLSGSKRYRTTGELGYETTTLDAAGTVTKEVSCDHVTLEAIDAALPSFRGTIQQVPPIFSAIRKGGKRLYEEARKGKTEEGVQIEARPVEIYGLELVDRDSTVLPKFYLDVECGGGTYIRSLVRDIGITLGTVATTIQLERTKQGQFTLEDALPKDDWSADNIYDAIEKCNDRFCGN